MKKLALLSLLLLSLIPAISFAEVTEADCIALEKIADETQIRIDQIEKADQKTYDYVRPRINEPKLLPDNGPLAKSLNKNYDQRVEDYQKAVAEDVIREKDNKMSFTEKRLRGLFERKNAAEKILTDSVCTNLNERVNSLIDAQITTSKSGK